MLQAVCYLIEGTEVSICKVLKRAEIQAGSFGEDGKEIPQLDRYHFLAWPQSHCSSTHGCIPGFVRKAQVRQG